MLHPPGLEHVQVRHRPRLLSDNGSCYLSKDLKSFLDSKHTQHTRGAPYHPITQGEIERYHRSMKNIVKMQNSYSLWELERELASFVEFYNHQRNHEAPDNMIPADIFWQTEGGIGQTRRDQDTIFTAKTTAQLAGAGECIIS